MIEEIVVSKQGSKHVSLSRIKSLAQINSESRDNEIANLIDLEISAAESVLGRRLTTTRYKLIYKNHEFNRYCYDNTIVLNVDNKRIDEIHSINIERITSDLSTVTNVDLADSAFRFAGSFIYIDYDLSNINITKIEIELTETILSNEFLDPQIKDSIEKIIAHKVSSRQEDAELIEQERAKIRAKQWQ